RKMTMKILAVDTAWDNMVVALCSDGKVYSETSLDGAKKHNSLILPMIDRLLEKANIKISEVDCFAAVVGPGSFTGIRIGVSSVNALAFACNKNCVAINALEELAYPCCDKEFYTAIDCRHNCYYYGKFSGGFDNMISMGEITAQELDSAKCKVIKKILPSDPNALIEIAKSKFAKGETGALVPLYLKKSQAEREYEAKNMDKTDI
ncbi:MAG: tRNA (adenosine(37)-N6)-threonylcarbamoyltransferase complex dimerization subunit type 1 TsaB, partial [Clostridia bacterium]|nr:tRNA (adenosine(37)-N6)-threonylcarbamoyltransferase complex dimerization subunit type 1 TsaB [Clostridia bacterium]